jgi:hypothetical protein
VTRLELLLRLAVCGVFVGHGAYGAVMAKSAWFAYFGALGVSQAAVEANRLVTLVGGFEIALGVLALLMPLQPLLLFMTAWKVLTELLRPAAGEPWWEFIERASNMVAPLALWYVMRYGGVFRRNDSVSLGQHFRQSDPAGPGPGRASAGG